MLSAYSRPTGSRLKSMTRSLPYREDVALSVWGHAKVPLMLTTITDGKERQVVRVGVCAACCVGVATDDCYPLVWMMLRFFFVRCGIWSRLRREK